MLLDYLELAAQVAALYALARSGWWRRWPSLTTSTTLYVSANSVLNLLLHWPHHYAIYFYIYWGSTAVQDFVRVWILLDVVKSFPGLDFLPKRLNLSLFVFCGSLALAAGLHSFHANVPFATGVMTSIVLLNRAVCIAGLIFFFALLTMLRLAGAGWSTTGRSVMNGLALQLSSAALLGQLFTQFSHSVRLWANGFDTAIAAGIFVFWFLHFFRTPLSPSPPFPGLKAVGPSETALTIRLLVQRES